MKILAIDDNQDNLISLKALIKDIFPDALTLTALTGQKGIELALAEDPDVILLDIVMPGMDGFEVCTKVKADKKLGDIPVIFITALKGNSESRIRVLECGADAFLSKPIEESEFTAQIRAMTKIKTANIEKRLENKRLARLVAEKTFELKKSYTATLNLLEDLKKENEARKKTELKLQESENSLKFQFNFVSHLSNITNMHDILLYCLKTSMQVSGMDCGGIYLQDRMSGDLYLAVHEGLSDSFVEKVKNAPRNSPKYQILLNGDAIYGHSRDLHEGKFLEDGLRAIAVIPIIYGDELLACINLASHCLEEVPKPVRQFIEVLAVEAGSFIARKIAEDNLSIKESHMRTLVKTIPDMIWLKDPSGVYLSCNPEFEKFFGAMEADIVGKTDYDFVDKELADFFRMHDKNAMDADRPTVNNEWITYASDGHRTLLETIKTPMKASDGRLIGVLGIGRDITELKHAENALRQSEEQVRTKLNALLMPEGDIGELNFADVLDTKEIQAIVDDFFRITKIGVAIIDLDGKILVSTGWQDICTQFHRVHPATCRNCIESDTLLSAGIEQGKFKTYKCKNNMWDIATPIFIGGKQMGNLFLGQFFFEDERLDIELFRAQARKYGFDEEKYIAALGRVPKLSRETVRYVMTFYSRISGLISTLSYSNLKLARSMAERERIEQSYQTLFREMLEGFALHEIVCEKNGNPVDYRFLAVNPSFEHMTGLKAANILGRTVMELLPGTEHHWINIYGKVALTGEPAFFENYSVEFNKYFEVTAFRPAHKQFACIFTDITERKRIENALQESEKRFMDIFYASRDAILLIQDEMFVDCNNATLKMLGYDDKKQVLMTHPSVLSPPVQPDGKNSMEKANEMIRIATEKGSHCFEWIHRRANGEDFPVEVSLTLVTLEGKNMFHCLWNDISERKRAEEARDEEEALIKTMISSIPGAFYMLDEEGYYVRWNAYQRDEIVGKPEEEMRGTKAIDTIHPDDRKFIGSKIESVLRNNGAEIVLGRVLIRGGPEFRWLIMTGRQIIIKGKSYLIGIGIDISEEKKAEDALRKSQRFLADIIENSGALIFVKDRSGKYELVNRKWEEKTGLKCGTTIGKTDEELFPEEIARQFVLNDSIVMESGKILEIEETLEYNNCRKLFSSIKFPLFDENGMIKGICGMSLDITDRKQAEEDKEKLREQLLQSQKMEGIGQLAGGIAHDFNNMLSVIIGYAEMSLSMEQIDPSQTLYGNIKEIRKAAQRSAELTNQLLAFARKQTINPKLLDLNDIVANIIKMLKRLIGENIVLSWKPGGCELWQVKMDSSQIDQILANLAVNARDAISGNGTLTIETSNQVLTQADCDENPYFVPGEYVMLAVSDTGCGMDKATLSHIFEPFFTTKEVGKGTGLGLATVYGIVHQNNGLIDVNSEPGIGTRFRLFFPRSQEDPARQPLSENSDISDAGGSETVLIVEDEESILKMAKSVLELYGYSVLCANNPDEAVKLAKNHDGPIHLLITDVVMPEMNGKEIMENIIQYRPDLKVIFMSGYTADIISNNCSINQDFDFLQKPFSVEGLAGKVREVLDRYSNFPS